MHKKVLNVLAGLLLLGLPCRADVKFDYGFAARLREEYTKNILDLNNDVDTKDNKDYFRLRLQAWGKWTFPDKSVFFTRLNNEMRSYIVSNDVHGSYFDGSEIDIDNFYYETPRIGTLPVSLKIGRQDIVYGEGFLLADGTPADGTRTAYFNAAKATVTLNSRNSLDIIYILDPKNDEFLPILNEENNIDGVIAGTHHRLLNISDESALGVYGKCKPTDRILLEPYYIYKTEDAYSLTASYLTVKAVSKPSSDINTIGAHVVYTVAPWKIHGEYAYQFGKYNDGGPDRSGNGGYLFCDRSFKSAIFSPDASIGMVYLSGDDPGTTENEGWDPIFSRYTWLSDIYNNTVSDETGISAYWTNLQIYRTQLQLNFTKTTNLNLRYNWLLGNENVSGSIFSTGKDKGQLYQAQLNHTFNKYLDGFLLYEYFQPGDFYAKTSGAIFWKWQLQCKF